MNLLFFLLLGDDNLFCGPISLQEIWKKGPGWVLWARSSVWILTLWSWGCQLVRSRLCSDYHSLLSIVFFIRKPCCCVTRAPGDIRSDQTGLETVGPIQSFSISQRKKEEILQANFSAPLSGSRGRDSNRKPRSVLWLQIRNSGRREIPRSQVQIPLPEDRLTLWSKAYSLLIFRRQAYCHGSSHHCSYCLEKTGFVPWAKVSTPHPFKDDSVACLIRGLHSSFCLEKVSLFVSYACHMSFCSQWLMGVV